MAMARRVVDVKGTANAAFDRVSSDNFSSRTNARSSAARGQLDNARITASFRWKLMGGRADEMTAEAGFPKLSI